MNDRMARPWKDLAVLSVLLSITVFETLVLAEWIAFPWWEGVGFASMDTTLTNVISHLSPALLFLLLYYRPVRFGVRRAALRSTHLAQVINRLWEPFALRKDKLASPRYAVNRLLSHHRLMLAIGLVTVSLVAFFPYRPDLNPSGTPVGIDTPRYINWVNQMLQRQPAAAIAFAFGQGSDGSRPLYLLILYLIGLVGVPVGQLVKLQPLLLGPALVLSAYMMVLKGGQNSLLAGPTAVLAAFSPTIVVGISAGYYANWLALVESNFLLMLLLFFWRNPVSRIFWAMMVLSIALFLTHPWTWALVSSMMAIFSLTFWKRTKLFFSKVVLIIAPGIAADILKTLILGARALSSESGIFALSQIPAIWPNVVGALEVFYGGFLGYWLSMFLALIGVIALRARDGFQRLLLVWVAVSSLPFAVTDSFHQGRIIYDLPTAMLGSLAILAILSRTRWTSLNSALFLTLVVLANASYAFGSLIQV